MAELNIKLTDGAITGISEDLSEEESSIYDYYDDDYDDYDDYSNYDDYYDGNSRYRKNLRFYVEKDGEERRKIVLISIESKHKANNYILQEALSTEKIINLLTEVIKNPMSYNDFLEFCKDFFDIEVKKRDYYLALTESVSLY